MATKLEILNSQLTVLPVWNYTKNNYKNRFDYKNRDVLMKVDIKKITTYDKVEKKLKETYYKIEYTTYSYPQYYPYIKGKTGNKQRKYKHIYNGVLELLELKLTSKFRYRCGADKKPQKVASNKLKSVSYNERAKIRKSIENKMKNKTQKEISEAYSKAIKERSKKGEYLSWGDFQGRGDKEGNNVMLDFYYRISYPLKKYGALYGKYYHTEGVTYPFFDKHLLRLLDHLVLVKKVIKIS